LREIINAYKTFIGRPEGKSRLGSPRHRWEENVEIDLREIGLEGVDWINQAQERASSRLL
jgi:hypothetical protein